MCENNKKQSSIALVNVWMGELPEYFKPWLISAAGNPTIDFFVFTNAVNVPATPANVHLIPCTFEEVKERIQARFDFEICLDRTYKLCDYKPSYGEAFSDHLKDYDFWGYCDLDLIWGNIRKYVTEDILKANERVFGRGHFTLMKNTPEVNAYYRTLSYPGTLDYKTVYTTGRSYAYDEYAEHNGGGTSIIMQKCGIPLYENDDLGRVADQFGARFRIPSIGTFYVEYDKGNIYLKRGSRVLKENMYYHYHERKKIMKLEGTFDWEKDDVFYYISPGTFVDEGHFVRECERGRAARYGARLFLRRLYVMAGEPQWAFIKRFLK